LKRQLLSPVARDWTAWPISGNNVAKWIVASAIRFQVAGIGEEMDVRFEPRRDATGDLPFQAWQL
jgi:hypothetical protein